MSAIGLSHNFPLRSASNRATELPTHHTHVPALRHGLLAFLSLSREVAKTNCWPQVFNGIGRMPDERTSASVVSYFEVFVVLRDTHCPIPGLGSYGRRVHLAQRALECGCPLLMAHRERAPRKSNSWQLLLPPPCALSRKAGFPRGHPFNPCSQQLPSAASQRGPIPHLAGNNANTNSGIKRDASIFAAQSLVVHVFCSSDSGGGGGAGHHGESAQGTSNRRPGLQRAGSGSSAAGGVVKGTGKGTRKGRRLPKRLRRAVPLFEEVFKRAHGCNFGRILEACCPLPDPVRRAKGKVPSAAEEGQTSTRAVERGIHAAAGPSPSDVSTSTLRDVVLDEDAELSFSAWSQEDAGGNDSGGEGVDDVTEEEIMNSGSTVKEACSQSSVVYLSQGGEVYGDVTGDEDSGDEACTQSEAKRRRRADWVCADQTSGRPDEVRCLVAWHVALELYRVGLLIGALRNCPSDGHGEIEGCLRYAHGCFALFHVWGCDACRDRFFFCW